MAITHTFLKALDSRPLIVFLSGFGVEISEEQAYKIHEVMSPEDNMIFYSYDEFVKSNKILNLLPNSLVKAFSSSAFYTDCEDLVKSFFFLNVRSKIVSDLRATIENNFSVRDFEPEKVIFIAHGLGSIIVWDYLRKYKPCVQTVKVIFLGSPLYLNLPWFLSDRTVSPYEGITSSFMGTRDPVCLYGKRKRGLGVEMQVQGANHNPYYYVAFISSVNKALGGLWDRWET